MVADTGSDIHPDLLKLTVASGSIYPNLNVNNGFETVHFGFYIITL